MDDASHIAAPRQEREELILRDGVAHHHHHHVCLGIEHDLDASAEGRMVGGRTGPLRRRTWMGGWGVLPMGTTVDPGDHHEFSTRLGGPLAMSHHSHHHDDVQTSPPTDHGSPESARAANLLVGIAVALLLIVLAVVVALA